jgi:predicted dehydrogenase
MATPLGSDTVRYGIIGVGMMGLEHLRNLAAVPGAAVTAVSDPHEGSRAGAIVESGRAGLPRPAVFVDHRDLLASGLCDAVVVASPNMTHAAVLDDVLDAVRTGGRADVSLEDGLLSVAVGVAAQRSIAEERAVTLDEVLAG